MGKKTFPIQEGQPVYLTPLKNAARNWDGKEPLEGVVTKIARKYFYVETNPRSFYTMRFERETFESSCPEDCNAGFVIWESKEDWYDFWTAREELKALRQFLDQQNSCFFRNESGATQVIHDLYRVLWIADAVEQ